VSRIGNKPIPVPKEVNIDINDDYIIVKGPKGELREKTKEGIAIKLEDSVLTFSRNSDAKEVRALHGLMRALTMNMIKGVTTGFERKMELVGVGYKVAQEGKALVLNLGFSHPVIFHIPKLVEFEAGISDKNAENIPRVSFTLRSIDKHLLGDFAVKLRELRPPEPYKGKGVKYSDEKLIRKAGKSGSK
jgi:large subunit ribosomal protein L6